MLSPLLTAAGGFGSEFVNRMSGLIIITIIIIIITRIEHFCGEQSSQWITKN